MDTETITPLVEKFKHLQQKQNIRCQGMKHCKRMAVKDLQHPIQGHKLVCQDCYDKLEPSCHFALTYHPRNHA